MAPPSPITVATHEAASTLAGQHEFPFYDAVIVASALEARCTTLYTQDMHHGMTLGGTLKILNPFVGDAGRS